MSNSEEFSVFVLCCCRVLSWFNTTPADYHVVFTSGCTSSLKLLAECFDFAPVNNELGHKKSMVAKLSEEEKKCRTTEQKSVDKQLPNEECHFVYLNDNHTSVVGMREVVASRGFGTSHLSIVDVQKRLDQKHKVGGEKAGVMRERHSNKLFTYPAQSNFDGFKYPLAWIENIERGFLSCHGDWYVALDAASYISTSPLDLSFRKPSFVTLSFYKMFGLPTGLGEYRPTLSSQYQRVLSKLFSDLLVIKSVVFVTHLQVIMQSNSTFLSKCRNWRFIFCFIE